MAAMQSRNPKMHKGGVIADEKNSSDIPPMSRLFIICSKSLSESDLRSAFEKFGEIEEIWIVKDKASGEPKGIAYVKYTKTSEAAQALEDMNGKCLGDTTRPIKVLVAANRVQGSKQRIENEEEKYVRLFVIVPKDVKEETLKEEFSRFGPVETITIIRDKITKEGKGFAYIKFTRFLHAALAYEGVGTKYKAVFAEPKPSRNSSVSSNEGGMGGGGGYNNRNQSQGGFHDLFDTRRGPPPRDNFGSNGNFGPFDRNPSGGNQDRFGGFGGGGGFQQNETLLTVLCSSSLTQDQLWRLFDIIPGLDYCQINNDFNSRNVTATVAYNNSQSAAYARDKIHGLEYPPGERLIIRMGSETTGNNPGPMSSMSQQQNDSFNNSFNSSTNELSGLPPPQPLADKNASCVQRCFVVCVPKALPINILRQIFCRTGDLIDVYMLPNKNCGYAKYASEEGAKKAMSLLHGFDFMGTKLKVLEAEELNTDRRKRMRHDECMDQD